MTYVYTEEDDERALTALDTGLAIEGCEQEPRRSIAAEHLRALRSSRARFADAQDETLRLRGLLETAEFQLGAAHELRRESEEGKEWIHADALVVLQIKARWADDYVAGRCLLGDLAERLAAAEER